MNRTTHFIHLTFCRMKPASIWKVVHAPALTANHVGTGDLGSQSPDSEDQAGPPPSNVNIIFTVKSCSTRTPRQVGWQPTGAGGLVAVDCN